MFHALVDFHVSNQAWARNIDF